VSGSCFGFEPVSELSFEYLRDGVGDALHVRERDGGPEDPGGLLINEWTPLPGRRSWSRLYDDGGGTYRLWIEGSGSFHIDPGAPSVDVPISLESAVKREERLWGVPALLCFLGRGDHPLHAAAVEVDGEAILLAAPGYAGKTTLAAGFAVAGNRVLSEDVSCLRLFSRPQLVPGPAMLRVRQDVAGRLTIPGAAEMVVGDDRTHYSLARANRGDCTPVPVRAFVLLRNAEDGIALERVAPVDSLRELWPLSFRLPTIDDRARCFQGVSALADAIPVWNLHRPLRLDLLEDVVEKIAADV
jgi:hypothetical protein